jgi:hypothetical protein
MRQKRRLKGQKKAKALLLTEKKHTLKSQVVVDKKTQQIICTAFSNRKCHDFRLFKESKTQIHLAISVVTDTGYQGLQKIHAKNQMPKKKSKKNPLTKKDKQSAALQRGGTQSKCHRQLKTQLATYSL